MTEFYWDCIGPDLTELILSYLPIPTIIVAASVCKFWNSIIHSNSFKTRISHSKKSWFFLSGQNKLFAFIPESDNWIELSNKTFLSKNPFEASINWSFTCNCSQTSPPDLSCMCNPLFGACDQKCCSKPDRFIAIYGIDHLFDIEDCLAADLPYYFRPGNSLCTALFNGKLYIFGTSSNFISCFDLEKRLWSDVKTLRPPGVMLSFLISCQNQLVLGGLCSTSTANYDLGFNLWRIDEETLEFSEIGIMPGELVSSFMDSEEDKRFPCFKCAGFSNLVYVFTENIGCVCEISNSSKCSWRRVSNLPQSVHKFDKIISFTCNVSLLDFLGNGKD